MTAGILQFALGIQTAQFTRGLDLAKEKMGDLAHEGASHLKELVLGFVGLEAVIEGVKTGIEQIHKTIEQGAALEQLHKQTGESVRSLYQLQQGMQAVGVSGDSLQMMSFRIRKALSGVNEMGETTNLVFQRLGLNMAALLHQSTAQQIQAIAGALAKSGNAEDFASQIFGRGAAMEILKIAKSMDDFNESFARTAADAAAMAKIAAASDKFDRTVLLIKSHLTGLFAGFSQGILPVLQQGADWLEKMDDKMIQLGHDAGKLFYALVDGFKKGDLTTGIRLAIQAGFEQAMPYAAAFCHAFAKTLINVGVPAMAAILSTVGQTLGYRLAANAKIMLLSDSVNEAHNLSIKEAKMAEEASKRGDTDAAALYLKNSIHNANIAKQGAKHIAQIEGAYLKKLQEAADNAFKDSTGAGGQSVAKTFVDDFKKSLDLTGPMPATAEFAKYMKAHTAGYDATDKVPEEQKTESPTTEPITTEKSRYHFEGTAFEKMGAVMGGHILGAFDPGVKAQQTTASNTGKLVVLMAGMARHGSGAGPVAVNPSVGLNSPWLPWANFN